MTEVKTTTTCTTLCVDHEGTINDIDVFFFDDFFGRVQWICSQS